jgi:hypothetical protein
VVADCPNEKIFPAHVHGGVEEVHTPTGCAHVQYGYGRDLTANAIVRDTMDVRTLPQEAVPVEPQAKEFTLQTYGHDKYRRTLADVFLSDGTHVNHTLVKDGWCWWYRKFAPGNRELERLEKNAREAKKGLWAAPVQVPPWEWRKRSRT